MMFRTLSRSAALGLALLTPAAAFAQEAAEAAAAVPNPGNNAWMMTATVLVMLMILPGLALFYGGLTRSKNMLSTMTQIGATASLAMLVWVMWGYSTAFGPEGNAFFSWGNLFLSQTDAASTAATFTDEVISEFVFISFQMTFAAITAALILGATAERIIRAPSPPPRPWAALPASIRRATVEYLRAAGAAFAVERTDTASLPLPPRAVGVSGEPPAPGCATLFRSWLTSNDHAAIAERALTLVDACPADAVEVVDAPAGPARNPATLGADGLVARRATLAVAVHGDVACTFPRLGAGRVVDVDDVDAEGAVVTKTGARCLLRRGDALLRSNVDAHGRVDHQTDCAYDGKVLEVHFFSRRNHVRTTETIAIVEDATSDDVLDELERRVSDADFVLPEALVQWRAPATRKGLVPEPLDALRCVAELLPAGCAGSMTLRERACWRGNGAPAARAYQVDVDAEVPSDARREVREWAEKRRIDVRFLR